jgi:transcriptional regulator with XRE-family HTH domain
MLDCLNFMDYLPVRPSPYPLESFSGYLARTAQANGVTTCETWLKTLHLGSFSRYDMTLCNPGRMPQLLRVSPEQLQTMTFDAVKQKFLCDDKQLFKLLTGEVNSHTRYCPLCVAESRHYLLLWRLKCITGCARHGCLLHDGCPMCGEHIFPLKTPLQVGRCSQCSFDLAAAPVVALTDAEWDWVRVRTADMTYLVQPDHICLRYPVSEKLVRLRQSFGISQQDIARDLCLRRDSVRRFESTTQTSILPRYMDYADYLGLSLREVLAYREYDLRLPDSEVMMIRRVCQSRRKVLIRHAQTFEAQLLADVKQAVHNLQLTNQSDGQVAISKQVGVQPGEMILYPRVKRFLEQIEQERQQRLLESRVSAIQEALAQLEARDEPPFATVVSQMVGFDVQNLRCYPEIDVLIGTAVMRAQQYIQASIDGTRAYERRTILFNHIANRIAQAEAQGTYLQKKEIAQMVRARLGTLRDDPTIYGLLEAHEAHRIQVWYAQKHREMEEAYNNLRQRHKRVTINALGRLIGLRRSELVRYETLWLQAKALVAEYREQRETELLQNVKAAVLEICTTGQKFTLQTIGQSVGMAPMNLKRYPSIYAYFNTLPELPTPLNLPPR